MILGLLPIEQAARMTVLSTFWRDMWFSLTKLHFDFMFFVRIQRKYSHACSDIGTQTTQEEKKNSDVWVAAALYIINKVLNQHNGLICTFFIDFKDLVRNTLRPRSFDLDQWLLFVTRKGVEEIYLSLMDEDEYRLPNCIFSCPTLRRLHLNNGISVESINGHCTLPNFTSLCFDYVDFDGVDLPVQVDFPMLKNLSFMRCDNMFNVNITAKKLDSLTINDCHVFQLPISLDLSSVRTLDLDNYSLTDFVKGCTRRGLQPQPLALNVEYLILLEVSESTYLTSDVSSEFIHLLRICPKLCQLDLNLSIFDVFPNNDEFRTVAQSLKMLQYLKLIEFEAFEDCIVFIKELLACFPALEEVVITRSPMCYNDDDFEKYKEELLHFSCASTKVKIVIIG
ncbi:PREDICTED: F-box/FBD/LRR-repeat protein At1g13570-like [Ipomoea nil]|uniref:F-box/FBD/LRR-repeat protein At1g13570-like n=1 Tax=Ipomoea nil TaxID=35883 RepID=UPI0009019D26|nr:PREDICTED: F-box/FBD/LRR-repeat protein At1g13570-like [Ipomoea nil]